MAANPSKPPALNSNNANNVANDRLEADTNNLNSNATIAKVNNCSCTNISIMHLFHEMKQEFPTIPDTIVQQCVNDNCHQRENCIKILRNEINLNPMPVQSYPSKVLIHQQQLQRQQLLQHQHNLQQTQQLIQQHPHQQHEQLQQTQQQLQHQQQLIQQQINSLPASVKPATPLKPSRSAPLKPTNASKFNPFKSNCNSPNCDSVTSSTTPLKDVNRNHPNDVGRKSSISGAKSDMPLAIGAATTGIYRPIEDCQVVDSPRENGIAVPPRTRPTTLNLATQQQQQQQQQRQLLNVQLQQRLQKTPLRKAPLPPLPPKPQSLQQQNSNGPTTSLSQSQQSSFSNESSSSCLTSPLSSSGGADSEISVNVSLSSPTTVAQQAANQMLKHRTVITVQPEPPYSRDLQVCSPTTSTSSSSAGGAVSKNSYTSVNFTLRPPSNTHQSTIDITAGPGVTALPGGNGNNNNNTSPAGGLTYRSVSYDARRGVQKNIHITVTDEASGVFTAGRIRPPPRSHSVNRLYEADGVPGNSDDDSNGNGGVSKNSAAPLRNAASVEQLNNQQAQEIRQQQQQQQQYGQPHQQAYQQQFSHPLIRPLQQRNFQSSSSLDDAALMNRALSSSEEYVLNQVVKLQKDRRDKLANALRDSKNRFNRVEQEITILVDNVNAKEKMERLDSEILELRSGCESLCNKIEALRNGINIVETNNLRQNTQQPSPQPQQHQQSFPNRTRLTPQTSSSPSSANNSFRSHHSQQDLGFIQHHMLTPQSSSANSSPLPQRNAGNLSTQMNNASCSSSSLHSPAPYQQHQQQQPPPSYHLYQQQQQQQLQLGATGLTHCNSAIGQDDESEYEDEDYDEDVDPQEMWACNMCTFRNHPQLNICEQCDNVRIKPGTIRIVRGESGEGATSSQAAASTSAAGTNVSLEHDGNNLTPQLLQQQFALHT